LAGATVSYNTLYEVIGLVVLLFLATITLAARNRGATLNRSGVMAITVFSFKEAIKARWLLIFAAVYFLIAINVPTLVLLAADYLPPDYLSSYLTTVVSLSFPFIPLLALPMGSTSIVDERESGTLQYVMSNPITKGEFFLGRALGLLFATSLVILLGFGVASAIVYSINFGAYSGVFTTLLIAGGLNMAMLELALVISCLTKRKATALGIGIFVWFFLTVISDVSVLSFVLNLSKGADAVVPVILLNPIEMTRILAILYLGGTYTDLGSTGTILAYALGNSTVPILWADLIGWVTILFAVGFLVFRHRDLA
jgi:ABC-type transport system involved in multi-copper enzyme maturation permease subunit